MKFSFGNNYQFNTNTIENMTLFILDVTMETFFTTYRQSLELLFGFVSVKGRYLFQYGLEFYLDRVEVLSVSIFRIKDNIRK